MAYAFLSNCCRTTVHFRLCNRYEVREQIFLRSPKGSDRIKILGINAGSILEKDLLALKEKWDSFSISTLNQREDGEGSYTEQYVNPVIDKFSMESNKWKCEFVVTARDVNNNQVKECIILLLLP